MWVALVGGVVFSAAYAGVQELAFPGALSIVLGQSMVVLAGVIGFASVRFASATFPMGTPTRGAVIWSSAAPSVGILIAQGIGGVRSGVVFDVPMVVRIAAPPLVLFLMSVGVRLYKLRGFVPGRVV